MCIDEASNRDGSQDRGITELAHASGNTGSHVSPHAALVMISCENRSDDVLEYFRSSLGAILDRRIVMFGEQTIQGLASSSTCVPQAAFCALQSARRLSFVYVLSFQDPFHSIKRVGGSQPLARLVEVDEV